MPLFISGVMAYCIFWHISTSHVWFNHLEMESRIPGFWMVWIQGCRIPWLHKLWIRLRVWRTIRIFGTWQTAKLGETWICYAGTWCIFLKLHKYLWGTFPRKTLEFSLNGAELSLNAVNSGNLINHRSTNWAEFKDPVPHMCLAGDVVASRSLT